MKLNKELAEQYYSDLQFLFGNYASPDHRMKMEQYMRNKFSFYGIRSPLRKKIQGAYFKKRGYPAPSQLEPLVSLLWQDAHREMQYLGMELTRRFINKMEAPLIIFYEKLIVQKSWWDTVDFLASNVVGLHLQRFPAQNPSIPDKWVQSEDIWLNRTALLFQLKYKANTNKNQLFSYIRHLKNNKEFFLQKAIGWSLREFSKQDAPAVIGFVKETELSSLAKREALKWLNRNV